MSESPLHSTKSAGDPVSQPASVKTVPDGPKGAVLKDEEKLGLSNAEAARLINEIGYNEMPEVTVSKLKLFLLQFTGTMPYMLEICIIISAILQDSIDLVIILVMLVTNAVLGFYEQLKAADSLAELTQKMETKIACLRDGQAEHLLTRCLVPGDVILLLGGCAIPADCDWFEGDVLAVNTAAMTGEPLPRKYPSDQHGFSILCGTSVQAGEAYAIVRKTGIHTEIGSTNMEIAKDKTEEKKSEMEVKILSAVKIIILITLIDVIIIFIVQAVGRDVAVKVNLATCLSIIVASIPIALPIVMQVTMALGAGMMAKDHNAVVTALPALQDISAMTILCSDKTGTLTTARITIHADSVWCCGSFTKQDVAMYAGLGSNRDKKEDAIDRSVIQHFDKIFGPKGLETAQQYTKVRNVGFNPIYKRVVWEYTHPTHGKVTFAKGLATKVLDTADHGVDDAADQWKCEGFHELEPIVAKVDYDFGKAGYKTLGVAVKFNEKPWQFVGILPMLDPPRHDSESTVKNLKNAGIKVKMITGDHLNIAKETCRLIGMGQNVHPGEATRMASNDTYELIWNADGFAQVLPKDKREVVLVLKNNFKQVVGMTGDGVNDAPALSAAQCGIAVDDATDAAKNAAAIILTTPGLSAIYSAVVESRRIFRKLKSYVTYRFAASIQIVVVLTLLIYISRCSINSLFIILLALFNDLTMLPIAYDLQCASKLPEEPNVNRMLQISLFYGSMETFFTLLMAYIGKDLFNAGIFATPFEVNSCGTGTQAIIWLQMFIATELLIFTARSPTYFLVYMRPHYALLVSVAIGCLIICLIANSSALKDTFGAVPSQDIGVIWIYNILVLLFIDIAKVQFFDFLGEVQEVLSDSELALSSDKSVGHHHGAHSSTTEMSSAAQPEFSNADAALERLSVYAVDKSDRLSQINPSMKLSFSAPKLGGKLDNSVERMSISERQYQAKTDQNRGSISTRQLSTPLNGDARGGLNTGSLKPNTPQNRTIKR